jgi:hypothetical protein
MIHDALDLQAWQAQRSVIRDRPCIAHVLDVQVW